jgi:protein-S-isoprenylcysteine O-methyltransferase Ste14
VTATAAGSGAVFIAQLVARIALNVAVYALLLFLPAGTFDWPRAWVLLALLFAGMLATRLSVFRGKEALLEERRRSPLQPGQPLADKVLVVAFVVVFPAYIAFIGLDAFHLHLMARPGLPASSLGLIIAAAGWLIVSLAFRENAFAVAIIKPQEERHQTVVDAGVYGVVRHPLYAGLGLVIIGVALWLESYAAALASIVPITLLVVRIRVEEAFLRQRLAGYDEYAKRIAYRLIPLIW